MNTILVGVPLLFQSIGIVLCNQNQFISGTANLCYAFSQDIHPDKVDIQMLDMEKVEYMKTWWPTEDTMIEIDIHAIEVRTLPETHQTAIFFRQKGDAISYVPTAIVEENL